MLPETKTSELFYLNRIPVGTKLGGNKKFLDAIA